MKHQLLIPILMLAGAALAETGPLYDPTRPPGLSAGADAGDAGSEAAPRLQSVLSPRGGRPMAIISGKLVSLGERIGDARLVRLTETEAVLRGPRGTERLALVPEVAKQGEEPKVLATDSGKRKKP